MSRLILFVLLLSISCSSQADVTITSSEVYAQVLLIDAETQLVRRFLKTTAQPTAVTAVNSDIKPRHVWQKAYLLEMKLVAFRRKFHLEGIAPVGVEPTEAIDSRYTWAQTQRLLTEIRIIRKLLGIAGNVGNPPSVTGKKPVDVFNKLAEIENVWDALTGSGFDASYSFAQALRLNEDVNMILRQLKVFDNAVPPEKNPADTSNETLAQTFLLLGQTQRLEKLAGLNVVDLSDFYKTEKATPNDVFNMLGMILAEVQQIKERIGLQHLITPPASYQDYKKPADVRQLLGYITNKVALIPHL